VDKTDAVRLVDQEWREALRVTNGTPVEVDEKLTVQYSWGWVILCLWNRSCVDIVRKSHLTA
jgi:hypothetical protein